MRVFLLKKILITLSFLLIVALFNPVRSQFWTEDFLQTNNNSPAFANGYISANGTWTVTDLAGNTGGDANKFYVSCTEAGMNANNCGAVCPGAPLPPPTPYIGQSLHIGNVASMWALLCQAGDCGALYNAGDGGLGFSDASTETRAESPVINCTGHSNITLTFNYIEFGDGGNDNAQVWYFDGASWSMLLDMPKTSCGDGTGGPCNQVPCDGTKQGYWTAIPAINLPASADSNPNVKIGFRWVNNNDGVGTDPSFAVSHIELTSSTSANTITAGNLIGPFCAGSTATLPFTSTGTFTGGNVYTAQLSDAAGSFASPVDLGTFPSTANVGNITLTFPANTPAGSGYLIQIVSSAPSATSNTIGPFTINPSLPLSVTVTANPSTSICPGQCVTFTASPVNGGTTPTYQWQINGVNAPSPSTNDTYTSCTLQNNDQVTVIVTSNATCVTNSPATSTAQVITYVSTMPFSVTLSTNPSPLVICSGDPIELTANTVNGGTPTYEWTVNGTTLPGINTQTVNYNGTPIPLTDGTVVCVISASSLSGCITNSPDTACVTVSVATNLLPTAQITADKDSICVGESVTFTSVITNGGSAPSYQWMINSNPVPAPAGTGSTFTTTSLVANDIVSLEITSNSSCVSTPTATSNFVVVDVLPFITPTITIAPNSGVCKGQLITFSSNTSGHGTAPKFKWFKNGVPVPGNSNSASLTISSSIFNEGDTLTCMMISNYPCLVQDTVFSNKYIIHLLDPATVNVGPDQSIIYGETVKFEPDLNGPVSQGTYLWYPDSTLSCNTCYSPVASPLVNSAYVIIYKNQNGCIARDTINIEVKPNYDIFIPSGFSPNGDNVNDVFYVRGTYVKSINVKIWDRFGGKVFESAYINFGWDGTKDYKALNSGVYVYYVTVTYLDGTIKDFKGNVTLSR